MVKENLVTGMKISSNACPDLICEPCLAGRCMQVHFLPQEIVPLNHFNFNLSILIFTLCQFKLRVVTSIGAPGLMIIVTFGHYTCHLLVVPGLRSLERVAG
jgi:hypothetical protein